MIMYLYDITDLTTGETVRNLPAALVTDRIGLRTNIINQSNRKGETVTAIIGNYRVTGRRSEVECKGPARFWHTSPEWTIRFCHEWEAVCARIKSALARG